MENNITSKRLSSLVSRQVAIFGTAISISILVGISVAMIVLLHYVDRERMQTELQSASMLIQSEKTKISSILNDYASWDSTYSYVKSPTRDYENNNLSSDNLRVLNVDFVLIRTLSGEELYSMYRNNGVVEQDNSNKRELELLIKDLSKWLPYSQMASGSYLRIVNGTPMILAISPITDTERTQETKGFMVMGYALDNKRIAYLDIMLGTRLHFNSQRPETSSFELGVLSKQHMGRVQIQEGKYPIWLELVIGNSWKPRLQLMLCVALGLIIVQFVGRKVLCNTMRSLVISRLECYSDLIGQERDGIPICWPIQGNDELTHLAVAFNRMRERLVQANADLLLQANTDALTGLDNRRSLGNCLVDHDSTFSMLLLDLDGFKLVNDSLGHSAGDLLLQQVANRMRESTRPCDRLFRLGGDEFAVLLPQTDVEQAQLLGERLLQKLQEPVVFSGLKLSISASIGVAEKVAGEDSDLLLQADLAMYAAKHGGKARVRAYDASMSKGAQHQLELEQAFRSTLAEKGFESWFQPVVDTKTGQVVAVELLARWRHGDQMVAPSTFIQLAEELGLIGLLAEQLLEKGLAAMHDLLSTMPGLKLFVNLSPIQFFDPFLAQKFLAQVEVHGLSPSMLVIELTESALLRYPELVAANVKTFADAGVSIQMDDFGTGCSSLSRLHELPFSSIKLERTFIQSLASGDPVLAQSVYDMANSMGLSVVAEGVETVEECKALTDMGYSCLQGFLFAPAMPINELEQWLRRATPVYLANCINSNVDG